MTVTPRLPRPLGYGHLALACIASAVLAFAIGRWSANGSLPRRAGDVALHDSGALAHHRDSRPENASPVAPRRWQERWNEGADHPELPQTETDRIAVLREMAADDPAAAMQLAESEPNWRRRGLFVRAVLRGWATRAPQAAVDWVLAHLRAGERHDAVAEIAAGAVAHPAEATRAISNLCHEDTGMAGDYGALLITELARTGEFTAAVEFANTASPAERNHWIGTAFFEWAQHQPQQAIAAVARIEDPGARTESWQSAVSGWASSDPASLVAFAEQMPTGPDRHTALHDGLLQWLTADPVAAVTWMDRMEPGDVFDDGAAAVATITDLVTKSPNVAVSWARAIKDPVQRSSTLADVMRQWASRDRPAALRYAESLTDLLPGDRISLLEELNGHSAPQD